MKIGDVSEHLAWRIDAFSGMMGWDRFRARAIRG
jgi:hypothetical protein